MAAIMKTKQTRGGKRPLSGRKKAPYKTTTVSFRVIVEFADGVKETVKNYVAERLKQVNENKQT